MLRKGLMKEELDRAESFKILQDAADGLRGIPDIHNKKDPVVKKMGRG